MKLVVFSICKDEEATIGQVLDKIPESIEGISIIEKIVISDGSTDKTVEVAQNHGAKVVEGLSQKRLAYRFQEAVELALESGADVAVGIDGDLQFNPKDIPKLVRPIVEEGYEFVSADRFTDKNGDVHRPPNMPTGKYYGNRFGAWVVSKIARDKFDDVTCGFRAYSKSALIALNINSSYTYTQESFQLLAVKRLDMHSVPIEVKYYPGRKSRVVASLASFVFGSAVNILRAFRDLAPLRFFTILGLPIFIFGLGGMLFSGGYWLINGTFTPYKFIGITGLYFFTLGIFIWSLGLIADMLGRSLRNQEKMLEHLKEIRYPDRADEK